MGRQKLSVSEKIRKMLAEGHSVKEISKKLKCSAGLVYQVRAYDKKKDEKVWKQGPIVTSPKSVKAKQDKARNDALNQLALTKPGAIRYGDTVFVPTRAVDKIVIHRKVSLLQRVKNFFLGA